MQVDPIKPTFKSPETERLRLKYDESLSIFAFNFNLRHYSLEDAAEAEAEAAEAAGGGATRTLLSPTCTVLLLSLTRWPLVHFWAQRYALHCGMRWRKRWTLVRSSTFQLNPSRVDCH